MLYKSDEAFRQSQRRGDENGGAPPDVDLSSAKLTDKQREVAGAFADLRRRGFGQGDTLLYGRFRVGDRCALSKSVCCISLTKRFFGSTAVTRTKTAPPLTLSPEQQTACDNLYLDYKDEKPRVGLLFGVTGSGKTSVFIKLIERVLGDGRGVIVMVPEISLTPQFVSQFSKRFGDKIAVFHSALSLGERLDEYKRVKKGLAQIVIGTRSAVFAPFDSVGLIIMDEEQEYSYKSENNPRYHAREIAMFRTAQQGGLLVLSSATPSVETFYYAESGSYSLNVLPNRYGAAVLPEVITADMNLETAKRQHLGLFRCAAAKYRIQSGARAAEHIAAKPQGA